MDILEFSTHPEAWSGLACPLHRIRLLETGIFEVFTLCELLVADDTVLCVLSALGKHWLNGKASVCMMLMAKPLRRQSKARAWQLPDCGRSH